MRSELPKLFLLLSGLLSTVGFSPQAPAPEPTPPAGAPAAVQAQTADAALARAREVYGSQGARAALPEFEKALALFRASGDRRGAAITLGLIGNCYKRLGDFQKAREHLQLALQMKRELGDRAEEGRTLSHLGLLFWEMGEYPQAVEHLNHAIRLGGELSDRVLEAAARNNLGLVYDEMGEHRRSLAEYNRALELYREAARGGANATIERGISDAIGNIGGVHLLLGEYAAALRYYMEALAADERLQLKAAMSQDLGNIGLCYLGLGRVPEAVAHLDRALLLARETGSVKEEADWRKARGSALVRQGKYAPALEQYREALRTYERAGLKREWVEALGDLGHLELRLGDSAAAEQDFRRAVELSREIGHPRGVTLNLIALGGLEWRRSRYEEAAALYREALARADEAGDRAGGAAARIQLALTYRSLGRLADAEREAARALEMARAAQARPGEAEALHAQGEVARALGRHEQALAQFALGEAIVRETGDPELSWRLAFGRGQALEALGRNEEALAAYQSAVRTIEQVRSELREARYHAGYIEDKYQVYVALVRLLLKMERPAEAFAFAEKLRARSYLDLMNRGEPPVRSEEQRRAESALRGRIRQLQRRIEAETVKPAPEQRRQAVELFSRELAEAERDYQNFLGGLSRDEPAYAAARAQVAPSLEAVQQKLPARAALVEYVLAEDALNIFVVTPEGLRAKSVAVRASDLRARVELLRELMLRHTTDEWRLPAARLDQILVEPIAGEGWLRGVERLYIVPHAELHYVPFAVLVRGGAAAGRLLSDEYVLAYLPAAAALAFEAEAGAASESVLAVAPASTRLRHTRQESVSVSRAFPKRGTLLLGAHATEGSFKRLAGRYDVIHLATHGFFNRLNPLFSGVALEPDAVEDGRLEVHEILGLRLSARLVTLSACDTALGGGYFSDVPAGDDLVGLTRAFLFAGSPSVVASLWEVNDLAAVRLMQDFYQRLARADKAAALAGAQRAMRQRGGRHAHPYYWGAFVLVGRMG